MLQFVFGTFLYLIFTHFEFYFTERFYAKRCGYDCSKCKAWSCQWNKCDFKRKKLNLEDKENEN